MEFLTQPLQTMVADRDFNSTLPRNVMNKILFLLSLFQCFSVFCNAGNDKPLATCAPSLLVEFSQIHSMPHAMGCYAETECHNNAIALARLLEKRGFEITGANILFMKSSEGLRAQKTRTREGVIWSGWHAVLEFSGFIFDLDFPEAKALPEFDYFMKMFRSSSHFRTDLEKVIVKSIPVDVLLNGGNIAELNYDPISENLVHLRHDHIWFMNDNGYPWVALRQYLSER